MLGLARLVNPYYEIWLYFFWGNFRRAMLKGFLIKQIYKNMLNNRDWSKYIQQTNKQLHIEFPKKVV